MEGIIIREARKEDCSEIKRLIKELADFEKMPDNVHITVDALEEDGFDSRHPFFHCYVAEVAAGPEEDAVVPDKEEKRGAFGLEDAVTKTPQLIGYALYFYGYSTWTGKSMFLEDLYVTPDYRSVGLGSALFDKVVTKACETGCSRMDFVVLNWNPAQDFYKRKGAVDLTSDQGWHYYRLNKDSMEKLAYKKEKGETED